MKAFEDVLGELPGLLATDAPDLSTAPGYLPPTQEVEDYISNASKLRGIDPEVAKTVFHGEGGSNWQSTFSKNGQREPSFGPFQLYKGGGLGNEFQQETGLDPADPQTWKQNVDFALNHAAKDGWGPWYGAKRAGITGKMGIDGGTEAPLTMLADASSSRSMNATDVPKSTPGTAKPEWPASGVGDRYYSGDFERTLAALPAMLGEGGTYTQQSDAHAAAVNGGSQTAMNDFPIVSPMEGYGAKRQEQLNSAPPRLMPDIPDWRQWRQPQPNLKPSPTPYASSGDLSREPAPSDHAAPLTFETLLATLPMLIDRPSAPDNVAPAPPQRVTGLLGAALPVSERSSYFRKIA